MKKFTDLINEMMLTEGAIGDLVANILKKGGKTIPKVVADSAENSVKKIVDDLVKSTVTKGGIKQISRKAIIGHPDYYKTIGQLANETSMIRHGMDLQGVSQKLGKSEADLIAKESTQAVEESLMAATKEKNVVIKADTTSAQRSVTNAKNIKATQAEMDAALSVLKPNQKMGREITRMEKILQNPNSVTSKKLLNELNKSSKQVVTTGPQLSNTLRTNTVTVSTKKGLFTATKDQLKKIPIPIRKIIIGKTLLATLTKLGLGIAAIYLIYKWLFPDEAVVLTDENDNDLGGTNVVTGEWAECIKQLIDSKEATVESFNEKDSRVVLTNKEYPDGLAFYTNGRVADIKTGKKGNWECVGGKPTVVAESKKISLLDIINEQTDDEVDNDVDKMIDLLDFPVSQQNLIDANNMLKKYENSPKGKEFLSLYQSSGLGGGDLMKSISYVVTTEPKSVRLKSLIQNQIKNIQSGQSGNGTTSNEKGKIGLKNIKITWDDSTSGGGGGKVVKEKSKYVDCNSKELPHKFGCKSDKIKQVQICLNMEPKYHTGNFGPLTQKSLSDYGYDPSEGITQEIYDKIIEACNKTEKKRELEKIVPLSKDKKDLSVSTDGLSKKLSGQPSISMKQETPLEYFNKLKSNGFIVGDFGDNRIKYRGPIPGEGVVEKLDSALNDAGYDRIKQKPKDEGEEIKFVWLKR